MPSVVRHYLLPIYTCTDARCREPYLVAVVNRKRAMPDKLWRWTGALALFGGAAEPGEDTLAALRREMQEELPVLALDGLGSLQTREVTGELFTFTVTPLLCGAWTQEEYQRLAASCAEGAVDWIAYRPSLCADGREEWTSVPWISGHMITVVEEILAQHAGRVA